MNTRKIALVSGVIAALCGMQVPAAAPSHQCAQLWDDVLRLGCYDTAFGKPRPPAAEAVPSTAPVAAVGAVSAPANQAPVAASPPPAVVAPAVIAPALVPAPVPVSPPAPSPAPQQKAGPVVSTVTALGKALDGRFRITLENGETWQQLELDTAVIVKVGDRVTLRPAAMGSRQLVTPNGMVTRVTRLK